MQDGLIEVLKNCLEDPSSFKKYILLSVKDSSARSQFGDELECYGSEKIEPGIDSLEKLVKECVVDVNNESNILYAAIQLINLFVEREILTPKIFALLEPIHGSFLQLSDRNLMVQNSCCEILESYWKKNLPEKEKFAVNVPVYLLARALCPIGKPHDVTRLNDIKEMLALIDFQCLSSASLISLLCKASSNDMFLKNRQGIEFLSYILTLDPNLMVLVNDAIKFVIQDLKEYHLLKVGEVYYEGLDIAKSKNCLDLYEKECIQGLIICALNCHRVGVNKVSQNAIKVLSIFHKHKKEHHIEEMLHRLYKPLLWRALDATNGDVRANATVLFLSVFPLIPAHFNKVLFQDTLDEQCSKIKDLMMDDHEAVRVCATQGCAQILEDFWKILPAHHLTSLLSTLCCEMTLDMSSSEVVVAALQGIQLLLNNPLSHVALKKVLPLLSNHIYHPMASVRSAMVSLLITLHHTSIFKFWDLVPAEDLLSIVENTKAGPVRQRIVSLLARLYFPSDESLSVQIQITLDMLRKHPDVHRAFYLDAYTCVGLTPSLRLVVGLMMLVKECTEKGDVTLCAESKLHLSAEDVERVGQVLEVCAVLVSAASKDIHRNKQAATTLCNKIVPVIPKILAHFGKDPICYEAFSIIMSELPKEGMILLRKQLFKMCKEKTGTLPVVVSASQALLKTGSGNKILSLWADIINKKLECVVGNNVADPTALTPTELPSARCGIVLEAIASVLSTDHVALLECSELDSLYSVLYSTCDIIPQYHVTSQASRMRADHFKFLVECLKLAARLSIHVGGVEDVVQITTCLLSVVENTKSGNTNRSLMLDNAYEVVVEGFLVLQHSPQLLTLLHGIATSLGDSELATHRLTLCKYMYRAAGFLGKQPMNLDLREVFARVLKCAAQCGSKRELRDVECLLLEVGVTAQKQQIGKFKALPWEHAPEEIVQVVTSALEDTPDTPLTREELTPLLQIILSCLERSDSFSFSFLPALQSTALTHPGVQQFVNLIT